MDFKEWWYVDALNDGYHKLLSQGAAQKIWDTAIKAQQPTTSASAPCRCKNEDMMFDKHIHYCPDCGRYLG